MKQYLLSSALHMNKKSASASKSLVDAAKVLKLKRDGADDIDDTPTIVIESELK